MEWPKNKFGSLGGQSASLDSLEGHPEKRWWFGRLNCIFQKKKKNLVLRCRDQRFDGVVDKRFGTIHF
jgi:hypothetical protein